MKNNPGLSAFELNNRRLAVENAIGSLRIEGMELDTSLRRILERYATGELNLREMNAEMDEYAAAIV